MLNIQVDNNYKLTSDGLQIVIQRKHIVDPTKSPKFKEGDNKERRETWKPWKYCSTIERALEIILQQYIFESNAKTLKELQDEIRLFKQEMKSILYGEN